MKKTNHFADLKNKTVIITGGHGFMGSQYSKAFVKEGCKVIIIDIVKVKKKSNNITQYVCDITKENEVIKTFESIINKYSKIDILINNASIDHIPTQSNKNNYAFENFDTDLWIKDLSVGLTGAFICSKIFGKRMANQKNGGNIINISSDLGLISPDNRIYEKNFVKPVSYSVVKHGIIGLTKYTSTYWAKKKVRCNCFAPGGMFNNQDKNFLNNLNELIPLKRMAKKNEYNTTLIFLASDASSYINGATIVADGGRSIW